MSHLETCNVLSDRQSGFCAMYSAEKQLIHTYNTLFMIALNLNKKH